MFRSSTAPGVLSSAQQRAVSNAERFNLIEQETSGCPKCGDPVLSAKNGYTGSRFYLEPGSGWSLDVITNDYGRRELRAFQRRGGSWRSHECKAAS